MRRAAIAAIAAVSLAAGTVTASPARAVAADPLAPFTGQVLAWRDCAFGECATLRVPLSYDDPGAGELRIAVSRAKATGARLGSLVVNPGGPGEPGRGFASDLARSIDPALRRAYDIVGFDPRGVPASSAVRCMSGRGETRLRMADPSPDTAAEERALWRVSGSVAPGCLARTPAIARHVSTTDAARDLDLLRSALGDERLNWLGLSYGTQLGTRYLELFPDRAGRFVLDGAVDPALDGMAISRDQSDGFQLALRRFARDCAASRGCVARTERGVIAAVNALLARADRRPIGRAPDTVNEAQAQAAVFLSLYSPDFWPLLRAGLREASRGDASTLRALADLAWDRTGPNRYAGGGISPFLAIACWDSPATPGIDGLRSAAREWSRGAAVPAMASAMSWGNAPCSQWLGHASEPPAPARTTTTAPVLVIGTRYDPATPYAWAVALAGQLPTSRLLTYDGDGHTAFGNDVACVDGAVRDYLLTGALPAPGTTCRPR